MIVPLSFATVVVRAPLVPLSNASRLPGQKVVF